MKKAILVFAMAAVAVSCIQVSEEAIINGVEVDTTATIDSTALEVEAEGVEASAE
jgi:hypothetical protein